LNNLVSKQTFNLSRFNESPVLGIIRGAPEDSIQGVLEACVTGGLRFVELTLNTEKAFSHVGLNYKDHIVIDQKLMRPAEVDTLLADYSRAKKNLKWKPKISFDDLVINMVEQDLENINKF